MDGEKSHFADAGNRTHILHVLHHVVFQNVQSVSAKVEKIRQGKSRPGKLYMYLKPEISTVFFSKGDYALQGFGVCILIVKKHFFFTREPFAQVYRNAKFSDYF